MAAKLFKLIFVAFLSNMWVPEHSGAPAKDLMCAEYIAPGINALPDNDDYKEYSDEDENTDDDQRSYEKGNHFKMDLARPKGTVLCPKSSDFCFSLWRTDENGSVVIVRQGCWQTEGSESCQNNRCFSDKPKSSTRSHRFCCCSDHMCNANITTSEFAEEISSIAPYIEPSELEVVISIWTNSLTWICVSLIVFIVSAILLAYICRTSLKAEAELSPLSPSGPGYSSNLHNVDNLKLCAMIGQGKYGTVWRGMINEIPVAVKIFPSQHKQYFINEKNIYSVNLMDSPSLLEYYGCDTRRTLHDNIEYLIVLSLAPLGCLQDWLHENTTSFTTFAKMAKSVARGLSHLHTELKKNGLEKPCICHRDLNTRNILVKADLSCCISDFGFALKTYGPRYEWKGEISLAETKSINEVGTLRYMAPEVLEGAVNLRDCETALKQIDIYSLGLILWELCTRCHDWYPAGDSPPPYASPYEAEIGKCPSFEQMQVLVSRHKARPIFPMNWGGGTAAKIAKETCEDCWDHDAEARLTALCAEERIQELCKYEPKNAATNGEIISRQISATNNSNAHTFRVVDAAKNLYKAEDEITIITPPNQILPTANSDFTDKTRGLANSVHTLLGSSSSTPKIIQNQILFEKNRSSQSVEGAHTSYSHVEDSTSVDELLSAKSKHSDRKIKGWHGVRTLIQEKLFSYHPYDGRNINPDKLNIIDRAAVVNTSSPIKKSLQKTESMQRPSNLNIQSKPNVSAPSSSIVKGVKKPPGDLYQAFTIVTENPKIVVSKSTSAVKSLSALEQIDDRMLKRQRSLEMFREVFGAKGSIERLRDPSQRVLTPGDVPLSVRKMRASKTLSLYDDRMMDTTTRNTL
ncbi:Bone morphogenetic protein receptor type-2 [Pseudolycoriella hygida]|uniref:receptor protein serine/threonine kinase n=1 Tax=Pseudolycoriella hygida TaxID=35572 RepID=A0A9Q0RVX5_9DIPT|nr:Bone morphogenetic protein receptor type-2 [Pseudolycoriella hygida]